jgi:hypothetical protein
VLRLARLHVLHYQRAQRGERSRQQVHAAMIRYQEGAGEALKRAVRRTSSVGARRRRSRCRSRAELTRARLASLRRHHGRQGRRQGEAPEGCEEGREGVRRRRALHSLLWRAHLRC